MPEQDFDFENELLTSIDDLTCWRSFKENMGENINQAICFFDRFVGTEPNLRQIETSPAIIKPKT